MSQAEVAHHANKAPEYLCSRPEKYVHFYKKALALSRPVTKAESPTVQRKSVKRQQTKPTPQIMNPYTIRKRTHNQYVKSP